MSHPYFHFFFFFIDTATPEIYTYGHTLSLHDALPIAPPVKSALMRGTGSPFRPADGPTTPREKQTIDTRTAAPSTVQPSSLHASKMRPPSTIGFKTSRFTPPRMLLVLTSPARCSRPAAIIAHAFANQSPTRSTPPGTSGRSEEHTSELQ